MNERILTDWRENIRFKITENSYKVNKSKKKGKNFLLRIGKVRIKKNQLIEKNANLRKYN